MLNYWSRIKSKKWFGWVLQFGFIVLVYFAVQTYQTRDAPRGLAPKFSGALLSGEHVTLDRLDKPVLVHFWATWCSICRLEQASIDRIAKDHRVIAIASQSGTESEIAAHVRKNQITMPVLVDDDGRLAAQYGVRAFPTSFIVNPDGSINDVEVGYTTEWGLRFRLWKASF